MTCIPYVPAPGLFINTLNFGTGPSGQWSFRQAGTAGNPIMELLRAGVVVDSVAVNAGNIQNWLWFAGGNYAALRSADSFGGNVDYRVWIFDLRVPTAVTHYQLAALLSAPTSGSLHLDPSQDDQAFFVWISDGLNSSRNHAVYRSATGDALCGAGPALFTSPVQRLAAIAGGSVFIYVSPGPPLPPPLTGGGTILASCPLPIGQCDVENDTNANALAFPEVVVGGSATLSTRISNTGDDCITVTAVGAAGVFAPVPPVPPLPRPLGPGQWFDLDIRFQPIAPGSVPNTPLPVSCTPVSGSQVVCRGSARAPVARISVTPLAISFPLTSVGASSSRLVTITNTGAPGDLSITLSVAASAPGAVYRWPALNASLTPGQSATLSVEFWPVSDGPAPNGSVTINSTVPGTAPVVSFSGTGCVPTPLIQYPPVPLPDFGLVEQGFRAVRVTDVGNTGDGPVQLRARIMGADAALFGIQTASGSITLVSANETIVINPVAPCGGGPPGTGNHRLGLVFWANSAPRPASATLLLEEMSGGTVVSSQSYVLSATIVPPVATDSALVIDRSGSMAGSKITAAIAASRLFVNLLRPDLDDRVAVVKYHTVPELVQATVPVSAVTAPTQQDIENLITPASLTPTGFTSIVGGVMMSKGELDKPRAVTPPDLRRAMVVLTDGIDNRAWQDPASGTWYSLRGGASVRPDGSPVDTQPPPSLGGIRVYAVGIGRAEDVDTGQLSLLSQATGGEYLSVTDVSAQQQFQLQKYFTQIFMNIVNLAVISDPFYGSLPGQVHTITFDVLRGDVGGMVVVYDVPGMALPFRLIAPSGEILDLTTAPPGYQLRTGRTTGARFLEFKVPANEPARYQGRWIAEISHPLGASTSTTHVDPKRGPTTFGIAIAVGSNFRMQPFVTPGVVRVGDPILLSAVVTEAGLRVPGCAVTVRAEAPDGTTWTQSLHDDGLHQDVDASDGEYAAPFVHTNAGGSYTFTFRAVGTSRDGEPVVRESVLSKYVEGHLSLDPQPPKREDACCSKLVRVLQIGLVIVIIALLWIGIMLMRLT